MTILIVAILMLLVGLIAVALGLSPGTSGARSDR